MFTARIAIEQRALEAGIAGGHFKPGSQGMKTPSLPEEPGGPTGAETRPAADGPEPDLVPAGVSLYRIIRQAIVTLH